MAYRRCHFVALALACLACWSCGGGSTSPPPQASQLPVIASFTAHPAWVTAGQDTTLSWSVTGATRLTISGIGAVTGDSVAVAPAADKTYVLTATNEFGSTTANVTVAVYPLPAVWFAPVGATPAIPESQGAYAWPECA